MGRFSRKMRRKDEEFYTLLDEASEDIVSSAKEVRKGFKRNEKLDEAMMVALLSTSSLYADKAGMNFDQFMVMATNAWMHGADFQQYDLALDPIAVLESEDDADEPEDDESDEDEGEDESLDGDEDDPEDDEEEDEDEDDRDYESGSLFDSPDDEDEDE